MAANLNNLLDAGLFTYGTYDSNNKIFNVTSTVTQISGVTGFNGTFSIGTASSVYTVADGYITNKT